MSKPARKPQPKAKKVDHPRDRPPQILVRMVSDVDEGGGQSGVADISDYFEGNREELLHHLASVIQFGFIRSIHIYFPEEQS